jgi:tRNA(Arg) A34 adenosine deaminase TadA
MHATKKPSPPTAAQEKTAARLLDVIEKEILPQTARGVAAGDKVFGAAVLRKRGLQTLVAASNEEHTRACPLWHGEMSALREFFALPRRPAGGQCVLLSTHEPCPMCASAIAWSGIGRVYFLFDYAATTNQFAIPHDVNILRALFAPAQALNRRNRFFVATPIAALTANKARLVRLAKKYARLSAVYQAGKGANAIPLK